MKLICVGGTSSGCGKTAIVCLLLKALPGWAAMKVTPSRPGEACPRGHGCEACRPPEGRFEVRIDREIPGFGTSVPKHLKHLTDTDRFAQAGASRVAFVRALPEHLHEALREAYERLDGVPGVIIESTTAMPMVAGLRVLVTREGLTEVKESARRAIELVDLFVVNEEPAREGEALAEPRLDSRVTTACAVLGPEHHCNREFVERCRRLSCRAELDPGVQGRRDGS